jgi:hypothetical protein
MLSCRNWQSYQVSPAVPLPKKCYCHRASETREHVDAFRRRSCFSIPIPFAPLDASIQFGVFCAVFERRIPLTSVYYITVSGFTLFEAAKAPRTKRFQRFHHHLFTRGISPFPSWGLKKRGRRRFRGSSDPARPERPSDNNVNPSMRCSATMLEGREGHAKAINNDSCF